MGLFPGAASIVPSGGFSGIPTGGVGLIPQVNVGMFFDKAAVNSALNKMERRALSRASLVVRRAAQKSIKKMGMAKRPLKVVGLNAGIGLSDIAKLPALTPAMAGVQRDSRGRIVRGSGSMRSRQGLITEGDRRKVLDRLKEIRSRKGSPAGSPPFTHVASGHPLGFRTNIYNAFDPTSRAGVAGPLRRGSSWWIPQLHEFGGSSTLHAYALNTKYDGSARPPIITWVGKGTNLGSQWMPLGKSKTVTYPARPFMRPALANNTSKIEDCFREAFGG
jgi:hypothetical protein